MKKLVGQIQEHGLSIEEIINGYIIEVNIHGFYNGIEDVILPQYRGHGLSIFLLKKMEEKIFMQHLLLQELYRMG